jgi:hypothetical protein
MLTRINLAVVTIFVLSTMAFGARADDETISVEKLPAAVKKAIKKRFPKAEIEKASKETEDGKTTYEVLLEIDDKPIDVAIKADGTILEVEREIALKELPGPVKKALAAKYPGAKIEKVEVVTKGENGPEIYEVAIKTEVQLTAKGKFVGAKEEEDEDEKPSKKAKKSKKDDDDDDDEKDEKGHRD